MAKNSVPVVLSVAGSDSGGGAGIQADLVAIRDQGAFATTAITAITAQNTVGVTDVLALPPERLTAQVQAVATDMAVRAVKVGMLANAGLAEATLAALTGVLAGVPVVVDPVMVATSGDRLLDEAAVDAVRKVCAVATVITPNLPEAALLAGVDETDLPGMVAWAQAQGVAVLITGGDADTAQVVDTLVVPDKPPKVWRGARVAGGPFHGTGCTLSSAVAGQLAMGADLVQAVDRAITYVQRRLSVAHHPGAGSAVLGALP